MLLSAYAKKYHWCSKKARKQSSADQLAALLSLTYAERQKLKITTIGACDVSKRGRELLSKQKKRDRDRIRATEKRRMAGAQSRATSLSTTRPWEKDGISRRTWERRRKKTEVRVAGPSHTIESSMLGDEFATTLSGGLAVQPAAPAGRDPNHNSLTECIDEDLATDPPEVKWTHQRGCHSPCVEVCY